MTDSLLDLPALAELVDAQPQSVKDGLTAKHMEQMLRRHYLPEGRQPGGIFAAEIGSPCGKRRADLIWMPTTVAGGNGLHGHEVKVSRADLVSELNDPAKADPWAQYCTYWWLVVSTPSLIAGLTIPDAWGVMAPPSGRRTRSMTVIKDAPKLTPKDPAPGIARIAAWQMYGTNDRIVDLQRDLTYHKGEVDRQRAEIATLRASGGSYSKEAQRVAGILAAVKERGRTDGLWRDVDDDTIVAAILNHTAINEAAKAVHDRTRSLARELERIVADPLSYALDELRKVEKRTAEIKKPKTVIVR